LRLLNEIQAFVAAAELGGFARAARRLGLTASGVGKAVARLEADVGVRLLRRTPRSHTLTVEGEAFYARCRELLGGLEAAREELGGARAHARGPVRITAPVTLAKRVLVPALPQLLAAHPELRVELSLSDRKVVLDEDGADVAVRVGSVGDPGLVARRIGRQRLLMVCAPSYLARRPIEGPTDLASADGLVARLPGGRELRPFLCRVGERTVRIAPPALVTIDDGEALVAAAEAGLGVCQVPHWMASGELARGALVEVLAAHRPAPEPISAVVSGGRNMPLRTRATLDFLAGLSALRAD
jgi:LysR family transcriptional regulator, regulator for bpeEF and oprC